VVWGWGACLVGGDAAKADTSSSDEVGHPHHNMIPIGDGSVNQHTLFCHLYRFLYILHVSYLLCWHLAGNP